MRAILGLVPALAWGILGEEDLYFSDFLLLAIAPAIIDGWVRLKVARIEATAKVLASGVSSGSVEGDES